MNRNNNSFYKLAHCIKHTFWNEIKCVRVCDIVCFCFALAAIYQTAVSNGVCNGIIPRFSEEEVKMFKDLSISFLSGYVLWLLTTYYPYSYNRSLQRKYVHSDLNTAYVLLLGLIKKYNQRPNPQNENLRDCVFKDVNHVEKVLQSALSHANIELITDEINQGKLYNTLKTIKLNNLSILRKKEIVLYDKFLKYIGLLSFSKNEEQSRCYITSAIVNLYKLLKLCI